ncbi:glyoxalase/bleomycin resistance/extradiol dioxygenase family protein [Nocardiopsis gilva YIM 90087]|uniref:Glyoxalase/bleomycin resistance/extradiol dioxygenase family protein n=1 Tax=Nocardiopsis gilva YIM 90087 TaxID=1235441 RepID=A0A223S3Y1_9ACTN|nr:VOC family protein [Nocardiopsis gilva]ASU82787.1 glyoxalase/bleomycin resistance/extradiol dioxygenase family protein [Nocardiopsis gilva YIM 90087]
MARKIFVNLPVKNLKRSVDFFTALGFSFDQQFTDENATCMIINDDAFAMLLVEDFFKGFTKKEICDASTHTEAIVALSADTRSEVDSLVDSALVAGASAANEPMEESGVYVRSFHDPDGHLWEVVHMDMSAQQA